MAANRRSSFDEGAGDPVQGVHDTPAVIEDARPRQVDLRDQLGVLGDAAHGREIAAFLRRHSADDPMPD